MSIPVMPGTHTWVQGGPVLGRAGARVPLYASDSDEIWVWDEDTNTRVTDLLDADANPVTSAPISDGWVDGIGVPVAVAVPSFSVGQFGKRMSALPVQTLRDASASLAPTDAQVATLITPGSGSASEAVLNSTYAAKSVETTVAGKVGKGELVLKATDYAGITTDDLASDTTSLYAAINNIASSGATANVYLPPGKYRFTTPLPNVGNIRYYSSTPATDNPGPTVPRTVLTFEGGMFRPTALLQGLSFENLTISAGGVTDGQHLLYLPDGAGLVDCRWVHCMVDLRLAGTSFVKQDAGTTTNNFFDLEFDQCRIRRLSTHTVPAFDITSKAGTNHVRFRGGWWHSQGCASTPFFLANHVQTGAGGSTFRFEGVIGEQNAGGLIHIGSHTAVHIEDVLDYDQVGLGAYQDDLFAFTQASGGDAPNGVYINNSGAADVGHTFAAGKYHLRISGGSGHRIGRIVNGTNPAALISAPTVGREWTHNGGRARSYRFTNVSYNMTTADDIVGASGTGITIGLPDPASLLSGGTFPIGRTFTIKNIGTSSVSVSRYTGASTIDGAVTLTLAAGEKATVLSTGANWITV